MSRRKIREEKHKQNQRKNLKKTKKGPASPPTASSPAPASKTRGRS
jgi:hypothetical protein